MKKSIKKNGFIAISMIYSVFILFVTILIAIMFSYITDRKSSNVIKQDIKDRFAAKLPEITYTNIENDVSDHRFDVKILARNGSFPVGNVKYIWSTNPNAVPNKIINNGDVVSLSFDADPGDWYLVTKACDVFDNCTINISKKYRVEESATLVTGSLFNSTLTSLASNVPNNTGHILTFRRTYEIDPENKNSNNIISTNNSAFPIYAFCTARNNTYVDCYYYSEAMKVKFNSNSSGMFQNFDKIQTIDLGDFDKSGLINVANFFSGCTDLKNIRTPLTYLLAPSISLPGTFYNDNSKSFTQIIGSTKGKMWITKDLIDYYITYDLNGGTLSSQNKAAYNRNTESFTLVNPTKEGYIFAGWSGGKNLFNPVQAEETEGAKIYSDIVEFNEGYVEGNIASKILFQVSNNDAANTFVNKLDINTMDAVGKNEATFLKDSTFNRYRLKINTTLKDSVLGLHYIQFENGKNYTISLNVDESYRDRAYVKLSQVQIEEGDRATSYERYVDRELKVTIPKGSQGNRHYVANWIPDIANATYTLTINPNGGSWNGNKSTVTRKLSYTDVLDIPAPTKDGYVFNGWKELSGAKFSDNLISGGGLDGAITIYNNQKNNVVTHTYTPKSYDNPLSSTTHELVITHSGTAQSSPGLGGFYQHVPTEHNKKYIHVFVAKVPEAYYLHYAYDNNSIGDGGTANWLTSNRGDGTWKTYAYQISTGSTGSVGNNIGYVYLSQMSANSWNPNGTVTAENVSTTMYVASSNIYDITNDSSGFGMIDGSAKLTAKWTTPVTLTINPNGGTYNGSTENVTISSRPGEKIDISNNLSKPGYVFQGWTKSGSGNIGDIIYFDDNNKSIPNEIKTARYDTSSSTKPAVYNNTSGGTVETSLLSNNSAAQISSSNVNSSSTSGGFSAPLYYQTPDRINVARVNANVPTGYSLKHAGLGNYYAGIGSYQQVVSGSANGTGAYKNLYLTSYFGHTGNFIATTYFIINGGSVAANQSVTWYVKDVSVLSFDKSKLISSYKLGDNNATLTAKWGQSGSQVTFNPNGGTLNSTYVVAWKNGYYKVGNDFVRYYLYHNQYTNAPGENSTDYNWTPDSRVITRDGYKFTGWYTEANGGVKVFNVDGSLVPSVSGISNAAGKWEKYDSNITLYAHWAPLVDLNASDSTIPLNVTMSPTDGWQIVTNANGKKSAVKYVEYGETYGNLPSPTSSNCTFGGWWSYLSVGSPSIESTTTQWNYKRIIENLTPGATYKIKIENAQRTSGSATQFHISIQDFTANSRLEYIVVPFGTNVNTSIKVPDNADKSHDLAMLFYAGIGGATSGVAANFQRVYIGTLSTGTTSAYTISSSTTSTMTEPHQYFAGWSC